MTEHPPVRGPAPDTSVEGPDGLAEPAKEVVPRPPTARTAPTGPLGREVERLEALVRNGPFVAEVQGLCAARVRERAFLIDPSRLCQRALLFMAHRGRDLEPDGFNEALRLECIDRAIDDLVDEDAELAARGFVPDDPKRGPHAFMTQWFAIEGHLALEAAVRFNGLPPATRRPFVALLLEGKSVEWCLRSGLGSREHLHRQLQRALHTLFYDDPPAPQGGPA